MLSKSIAAILAAAVLPGCFSLSALLDDEQIKPGDRTMLDIFAASGDILTQGCVIMSNSKSIFGKDETSDALEAAGIGFGTAALTLPLTLLDYACSLGIRKLLYGRYHPKKK